jgi:glycosyltransferase involved in cell wall biosynthesis
VDAVEDGVTGLVVPAGDTRALRAALERLLGDSALRRRLGDTARERAEATLALPVAARALIAVYDAAAG